MTDFQDADWTMLASRLLTKSKLQCATSTLFHPRRIHFMEKAKSDSRTTATISNTGACRSHLERQSEKVDEIVVAIEPKLEVLREAAASMPNPRRSSQMDRIEQVLAATRDLRSGNGNLSARNIAELYGISLSELGKWINRSWQALNKTPDAESIQNALGYFERIARLRLTLSDDDFRKLLCMPKLLEGFARLTCWHSSDCRNCPISWTTY
jgi:truncated hemoglobin YjbI